MDAPPADLEVMVMQADLAHQRIRVERRRGIRFEERDERAALLGQNADVLDRTEADLRQELVNRCVRRKVADVDRSGLWGKAQWSQRPSRSRQSRNKSRLTVEL